MPTMTEYLQRANDTLVTIIQVETKEALEAVDEIAAVDGVDALFIGPFDLGKSDSTNSSTDSPSGAIANTVYFVKATTSAIRSSMGS